MTYLSVKKVKGKEYTYLMKSIRLPNGKVISLRSLLMQKNKSIDELAKENKSFY